jgi:O-acetyl-ADP-ribose deacetylase (regulator of RNase III)
MTILDNRPGFTFVQGDILQDHARILVCPVNCVPGVLGAGLALQFSKKYPALKDMHARNCKNRILVIGTPVITDHDLGHATRDRRSIVLFPTKGHWENDSRLDWVFSGLAKLYGILGDYEPDNEQVDIAIPALGCGLGGLNLEQVGPLISLWAMALPERFNVRLYHTHGR